MDKYSKIKDKSVKIEGVENHTPMMQHHAVIPGQRPVYKADDKVRC